MPDALRGFVDRFGSLRHLAVVVDRLRSCIGDRRADYPRRFRDAGRRRLEDVWFIALGVILAVSRRGLCRCHPTVAFAMGSDG